ncbi:hypothetical protein [Myroides sp. WP-1]|uniref:hypothetical protein n=1 Tax=Myroides sp. WP-1 TaxID=2759944 RepID=UPI0015FAE214|nr:hypothetical protein [Myroides sp. WP-1]MBB1140974.1 hypothetical protein [Myroides sp. WP-1]
MNRKLLTAATLLLVSVVHAQVGIGTSTPNKSSELTIMSRDKGILIPNINLQSTVDRTTIKNGNVESLLVYANAKQGDVKPGFYYWDKTKWVRIVPDVDIADEVVKNFKTIIENETVVKQLEQIIQQTAGGVFYDGTKFEYIDENGVKQLLDISTIVKTNETLTTLVDNNNGTYTYTSENGTRTIIDVPQSVIKRFETIRNNEAVLRQLEQIVLQTGSVVYFDGTNFEYNDAEGYRHSIDILNLVRTNETLTTLVDNQNGTYTYTSEQGVQTTIDVPQSVIKQFENIVSNEEVLRQLEQVVLQTGSVVYYDGNNFEYNAADGSKQIIDILAIVRSNETQTTLDDNKDGTYTYTSENGTITTINVPQNVIDQFENIVGNNAVMHRLKEIILQTGGNVYFTGTAFEYNDENGDRQVVNINKIVKDNETLTILSYDTTTGILTYKDEHQASVKVDVKNAVKSFETVTSISSDLAAGTITFTDEKGTKTVVEIESLIKANEIITKLVDHGNGSFTYYNEKAIDSNGNPIAAAGVKFTVPKVEKYDLTKTIRFSDGMSTNQSWSYNEMNFTLGAVSQIYRLSNETYKSVYRAYFSANNNPSVTKYMHLDFTVKANTNGRVNNAFGAVEVFSMIELEIYVNGSLMKTMNERIYTFGGSTTGWDTQYGDYSVMIAFPNDLRLNSSGNTIDIRIKPTRNNFFKNATKTDPGYFLTGSANVFNVVLDDNLEINIFEKQ